MRAAARLLALSLLREFGVSDFSRRVEASFFTTIGGEHSAKMDKITEALRPCSE